MDVKQAKDFLVEQTSAQASLEGAPLSAVEKKVMYFKKGSEETRDTGQIADEFAGHYDSPTYEAKVSGLMYRAYQRLQKDSSQRAKLWDDAIEAVDAEGDYIWILWQLTPSRPVPFPALLGLLGRLAVLAIGTAALFFFLWTVLRQAIGYFFLALVVFLCSLIALRPHLYREMLQGPFTFLVKFLIGRRKPPEIG